MCVCVCVCVWFTYADTVLFIDVKHCYNHLCLCNGNVIVIECTLNLDTLLSATMQMFGELIYTKSFQ